MGFKDFFRNFHFIPREALGIKHFTYLIGCAVEVVVVLPEHLLTELLTNDLHGVLGKSLTLGVEEAAAVLVLCDPATGEGTVLNIGQNCLHVLLGVLCIGSEGLLTCEIHAEKTEKHGNGSRMEYLSADSCGNDGDGVF